jgi:hypothetical protein
MIRKLLASTFACALMLAAGAGNAQLSIISLTAPYTAQPTDCGKIFSLGGNAFYTFTLGNAGNFASGCQITFFNADSGRGKGLSVAGFVRRLFPQQTVTFTQAGGAWAANPFFEIYIYPNNTLHVNFRDGSDDPLFSDCLATGPGACKTFQGAVNIAQTMIGGLVVVIQPDCEQVYDQPALNPVAPNGVQVFGTFANSHMIHFVGNPVNPSACQIVRSTSGPIFDFEDFGAAVVDGFFLGYSGAANGNLFYIRQIAGLDANNIIFSNNIRGVFVWANNAASFSLDNVSIQGNAASFINAQNAATVIINNLAVPTTANMSAAWFIASQNAVITGGPGWNVTGSVSGQSFACTTNATINFVDAYPAGLSAGGAFTGCRTVHEPSSPQPSAPYLRSRPATRQGSAAALPSA